MSQQSFLRQLYTGFSLRYLLRNYRSQCRVWFAEPLVLADCLQHPYFDLLYCRYQHAVTTQDRQVLLERANNILRLPLLSIKDKSLQSAELDPQCYVSFVPYLYLDERDPLQKSQQKPKFKDGRSNPFLTRCSDKPKFAQLCARIHLMAIAQLLAPCVEQQDWIKRQLHSWFVDPLQRMHPQMRMSQLKPWHGQRTGYGLIDARWLVLLIDALVLLRQNHACRFQVDPAIFEWLLEFANWILQSKQGLLEVMRTNNRGSWVDVVLSYIALAAGKAAAAASIINFSLAKRPTRQIDKNGQQPLELQRYTAVSYSLYNLFPLHYLMQIQAQLQTERQGEAQFNLLLARTDTLYRHIGPNELGKIEHIDFSELFDLNLYYPYSFAQLATFPAVLPFTKPVIAVQAIA